MRLATIVDGVVRNVTLPPPGYIPMEGEVLIDAGVAVAPGWTFDGADFAAPAAPTAAAAVSVTRRQALRALLDANLLDAVEAAITALPEPERSRARIDWDNATDFRRDFPLLVTLAAALGLTASQVDDLFAAAAAIT